jgi:general secretion pathway protein B
MSFILDALKKSESDRQRQSGPALYEVKVAPPKARFPVWAIAIVALLIINTFIVGYLLLRRSSHGDEAAAANLPPAVPPVAAAPVIPAVATPPAAPPTMAPATAPPLAAAPATAPPLAPASASAPPPATLSQSQPSPPANQQSMGAAEPRMPERDPNEPTLAGSARDTGGILNEPAANPDDYAPAAEPGSSLFKGHVKRGTESGLVLYQDAVLVPGANLPQLRLDLHVYAASPQDRFALINMHKLHEGDSLPEGVRVENITPDGVIMSHNGSKFLLPRE